MKRDKEGHYIMIKGSIQEEDITIINIYAPSTGTPQYVRQMLTSMKGEIKSFTDKTKLRDFSTQTSSSTNAKGTSLKGKHRKGL